MENIKKITDIKKVSFFFSFDPSLLWFSLKYKCSVATPKKASLFLLAKRTKMLRKILSVNRPNLLPNTKYNKTKQSQNYI